MKLNKSLDIPDELVSDYLKGKIDISNAVIRSKETGKIIKYAKLKSENKLDDAKELAENVGSKKLLIGIGVTVAIVTISGIVSLIVNKASEKNSIKIPKCVEDFQKKFHKYLKEAQKGILNEKTIDELLKSLDEVENMNDKEVKIDFSTKEIKFLLNKIYEFTNNINEENKAKFKAPTSNSSKNIIYLKDYLQYQKQIATKVS